MSHNLVFIKPTDKSIFEANRGPRYHNSTRESSTPLPTAIGQITVKDANLTTVAIYAEASADSKVTGTAQYGVTYPF